MVDGTLTVVHASIAKNVSFKVAMHVGGDVQSVASPSPQMLTRYFVVPPSS